MIKVDFRLPEEVILKPGTRQCSGRIRDGKFLYYLPKQMKAEARERVITTMRPRLEERLASAYTQFEYYQQNRSTVETVEGLRELAQLIYTRKYPAIDFPLTIKFRRQKTVMGTYRRNVKGEVTVNVNDYFKNAPLPLLEYIISHELSHHHCPGHDRAFYRELSALCPEHAKKRQLANDYLILKEAGLL